MINPNETENSSPVTEEILNPVEAAVKAKPGPKKGSAAPKKEENVLGDFDSASVVIPVDEQATDQVGVFTRSGDLPTYATEFSSCFDIKASFSDHVEFKLFSNRKELKGQSTLTRKFSTIGGKRALLLEPGDRALVPTGLFFDLPEDMTLELFSRSGYSFKTGLILTNSVGIVDADYIEEVFISVTNNSLDAQYVVEGDRIAQGRIVPSYRASFIALKRQARQKTSRIGGFGSTGSN